ncbi:MAG: glycosyltransferase family 1 protein, partial [Cyclobacteriaceae bacterium]
MRIAIVINTSWNIYNFRMGLIRALQKKGYEVSAIAPLDDYSDYLVAGGCDYHPIAMENSGNHPVR